MDGFPPLAPKAVIATHNAGKLAEMRDLLEPHGVALVSAGELGLPEPAETGHMFSQNAAIKAHAAAQASGLPAIADDSGLCVDALFGAPGLFTADWALDAQGQGPRDWTRAMSRVEAELRKRGATAPDQRRGQFVSAIVVAWPDGTEALFEAAVPGTLVWPPRGEAGFGYDPMFVPNGETRTFAELTRAEKHRFSHRARALAKLTAALFG